ncbi:TIGR04372 family glycosyltransferase [Prochlorococcus sp. AH-716-E17]|nr:TIGR04372 family glycosyltransferase [Prochlorococcus sp. AH-716-E17]
MYINRNYFGESIYEYVNALSNIDLYLKSNCNEKITQTYLSSLNIFITGKKVNNLLDDWFHMNLQSLLKNKQINKIFIESKSIKYKIPKNKEINIIYRKKLSEFFNIESYLLPRFGVIGSYTNRFDLKTNYSLLKKNKSFIPLEYLSEQKIGNDLNKLLKKIISNDVVVFYDYDKDNRKGKRNLEYINNNNISDELYLRDIDNQIIFDTLNFLLKKKYSVVRLGRSNNPFPIKNKNFHDLAFNLRKKSNLEVLDFLIPFNSKFCITLGSGAHECARLFGLPIFFVGYHRFDNLHHLNNSMIIPKKFFNKKDNLLIPLTKLINMRIIPYKKLYWESKNIYIKQPSSNEIIFSLKEFLKYIEITDNKNFSKLRINKIQFWQKYYLKNNTFYLSQRKSEFGRKEEFSVIISKFELERYSEVYFG